MNTNESYIYEHRLEQIQRDSTPRRYFAILIVKPAPHSLHLAIH
jgi:hypothetical protein